MDVGFWLDEMANIKMSNNFDKILATCRSRGVYCVPILQSLAQLKTLFADGAWEGIVGNCDTFIYLGGNEASTYEYVSKLLGKWMIDKRTSGESKGSSGSYSQNYDVLDRELMLEYELRLLPDDGYRWTRVQGASFSLRERQARRNTNYRRYDTIRCNDGEKM